MVQKIDDLRKKYEADADAMGSKQRFGYFSIPPSHTAAKTDFSKPKCRKNNDGRVEVDMKNILSGTCSSGVLKKSFFSVPKSIYQGDPYVKGTESPPKQPIKVQNVTSHEQREVFKPAKLNKTLSTPAYEYMCENPPKYNGKRNRNNDGSVKTQQRNIFSNSLSKISQEKGKHFKYIESGYDNEKKLRHKEMLASIVKRRGEGPFRSGSPVKEFFATNVQAFNDHQIKPKVGKVSRNRAKIVNHEAAFRPSCRPRTSLFSYPKYDSQSITALTQQLASTPGSPKLDRTQPEAQKKLQSSTEPFRLSSKKQSSKPCPSIAYSKINILRHVR